MTGRIALTLALWAAATGATAATYTNPLAVTSAGGPVTTCADPSVVPGGEGDPYWYMACTSDPLNGDDRDQAGALVFHLVPLFRSRDLVTWEHMGDAFDRDPQTATPPPPDWLEADATLWAPDLALIDGRWQLTFAATGTTDAGGGLPGCTGDSAIGHATAPTPLGPWSAAPAPLVAPRAGPGDCEALWTFDPEVGPDGRHLYYGSYKGGIEVRALVDTPFGLAAPADTAVRVTIAERYEGAEVVLHDGWHWIFVSAANCCAGPQTGYAVFAGRSRSPTGPFLDRDGVALDADLVGGTPVIRQNGNRWIGAGHNTLIADRAGQWWTLYHAVDEGDPWLGTEVGFTRRPVLLDRIDWIDGWPVLNGGAGPSDAAMPGPATAPGAALPGLAEVPPDRIGPAIAAASDSFDAPLDGRWSGRQDGVSVSDGSLRLKTQAGDLFESRNDAAILGIAAPPGDYIVETDLGLPLPADCCETYVQAGLVIADGPDAYVKLVVVAIGTSRQTEFAREVPANDAGTPRYGSGVGGPVGTDVTHLRIAVRRLAGHETYSASTSRDGVAWRPAGTWTHRLGPDARIGLVAMGGVGQEASLSDLRVSRLCAPGSHAQDCPVDGP